MKTLITISTLTFFVMFSSTSFAEWKRVTENAKGMTFYVDFERIRKHGGYVYYWVLSDYLKPTSQGYLSNQSYNQGDCTLFRFKSLSVSFHEKPMGKGNGERQNFDKKWIYTPPNSVIETILKSVCSR